MSPAGMDGVPAPPFALCRGEQKNSTGFLRCCGMRDMRSKGVCLVHEGGQVHVFLGLGGDGLVGLDLEVAVDRQARARRDDPPRTRGGAPGDVLVGGLDCCIALLTVH